MQPAIEFDNSYARLPERFYSKLMPTPVKQPALIALNAPLAQQLNFDVDYLRSDEGVSALAGNTVLEGANPLAMVYAGQQFGNWVPQLGDGRALLLGEVVDANGIRTDVQLKGSGPTPYSRMGDGRAWLGPVLREYIVSEAMAAMGVPTTRALAAVATGESVVREQVLPGAILTRVSKSHLRVGTFQYFISRKDIEGLKTLADYAIERLYSYVKDEENPNLAFLKAVIDAQARLVSKWMNLGFIHGVMNTDNVSVAGETIDYGPCAFMDHFKADRVFSSIDQMGRYAYANQPAVTHWNLVQFAQAILPLLGKKENEQIKNAQEAIDQFPALYEKYYRDGFNTKLGLSTLEEGDAQMQDDFLALLAEENSDFTLAFRSLLNEASHPLRNTESGKLWFERWDSRLAKDGASKSDQNALMRSVNPAFIPRNHRIEEAIKAALLGDYAPFERLVRVLTNPFDDQEDAIDLMDAPLPQEVIPQTFCGT